LNVYKECVKVSSFVASFWILRTSKSLPKALRLEAGIVATRAFKLTASFTMHLSNSFLAYTLVKLGTAAYVLEDNYTPSTFFSLFGFYTVRK